MAPDRNVRTAQILLTLMAVCFGGTWVAGKVAVDSIPPITLAAARFAIASALLSLWVRSKQPTGRRVTTADLPLILAMGLTAIAGYNMLFLYGLKLAPASDGAIIVPGLAPILTAALAWPVLRERIGRWGIAGLGTALVGLILVMNPGREQASGRLLGDLLFFAGAGCWAIYSVIGKTATARFNPVNATLYGTVTGAPCCCCRSPSLNAGGPRWPPHPWYRGWDWSTSRSSAPSWRLSSSMKASAGSAPDVRHPLLFSSQSSACYHRC